MGAIFCITEFPPSSDKDLIDNFSKYQDNLIRTKGDDLYAGHLGIKNGLSIKNKCFKTIDEASDYIDSFDKWGPAIAVKVGDFKLAFPRSKKEINEVEKLNILKQKFTNWKFDLLKRTTSAKSAFRGCKKCGSKIATKFISQLNCPICGDNSFVETETDKKQYLRIRENLNQQMKKVDDLKKVSKANDENIMWVVGGWVSS